MNSSSEQIAGGPPLLSAVVVTYQPDESLLSNLRKLSGQVAEIIVVDNGSEGASARWVESAGTMPGVSLIRNGSNLGIAAALNIGVRRALQLGRPWVATLDQDSTVPDQYFEQLFQAYRMYPISTKIGMIVPGGWGASLAKKTTPSPNGSFVSGAVTSGSLIKGEMFLKTGFFDEALFIDYVDTDFCLRVRKDGFKILSVGSVFLQHELGEKQVRRLFGFGISFRVHAAWRYYYIVRNRLVLYRRYWLNSPLWFLHDSGWLLLELGRIVCLENGRGPKLRAVLSGIKDGLRGKTGRHPSFPPNHK